MIDRKAFHTLLLLSLLLLMPTFAFGQLKDSVSPPKHTLDFRIVASAMLYNQHLPGMPKAGFMLPATAWRPLLQYAYEGKYGAEVGMEAAYLYGAPTQWRLRPILTLWMKPATGLTIMGGTISGKRYSGLPDALRDQERQLLSFGAQGAHILYSNSWLDAQAWLKWDRYIWQKGSQQERFAYGARVKAKSKGGLVGEAYALIQEYARTREGEAEVLPPRATYNAALHLGYMPRFETGMNTGVNLDLWGIASGTGPWGEQKHGFAGIAQAGIQGWGAQLHTQYLVSQRYLSIEGEALYHSMDGRLSQCLRVLADYSYKYKSMLCNGGVWLYYMPHIGRTGVGVQVLMKWDQTFKLLAV